MFICLSEVSLLLKTHSCKKETKQNHEENFLTSELLTGCSWVCWVLFLLDFNGFPFTLMTTSVSIVLQMAEKNYTPNRSWKSMKLKVLKLNGFFLVVVHKKTRNSKCEMSLCERFFSLCKIAWIVLCSSKRFLKKMSGK